VISTALAHQFNDDCINNNLTEYGTHTAVFVKSLNEIGIESLASLLELDGKIQLHRWKYRRVQARIRHSSAANQRTNVLGHRDRLIIIKALI
jgi:hypothetical protein